MILPQSEGTVFLHLRDERNPHRLSLVDPPLVGRRREVNAPFFAKVGKEQSGTDELVKGSFGRIRFRFDGDDLRRRREELSHSSDKILLPRGDEKDHRRLLQMIGSEDKTAMTIGP